MRRAFKVGFSAAIHSTRRVFEWRFKGVKLRNVLFQRRAPHVLLIDLGRAGDLGRIAFEPGQGGMRDYMSIKRLLRGASSLPLYVAQAGFITYLIVIDFYIIIYIMYVYYT